MIPISKPYIGEEEKQAVLAVLDSGMLAQGPRVAEFEERFAALCGVRQAVATSSGTTALHLALLAHGIGPGDEVITSPFTFIASANSILFTGATPVFVDVDEETFNLNPALVEATVTPRTRAIMPVHLYGYICDMDALQAIAGRYNLAIIEDACQAVGATFQGLKAGSFGTGVFSLYATKNVMSAEGGMITTNDEAIAEQCRLLRSHGMKRRYYYETLGYNFRLTDLQAAIGLAQLQRLERFTERRRANAAYLTANIHSVITPRVKDSYGHVWHQYTVRVGGGRDRDAAVRRLNEAGIGTGVFYPVPVHQHDHIRQVVGDVRMPVAERLAREVISLPVHPLLSQDDLETIAAGVNRL
ncbi:MAG: DegT/DnrJ/EryC1/StrS aminotransferase family protein [Chloroflexi bacterium]|nr:DegT/DnrJ/EryC1/StrS aminotransferase family protein [Chloroflexota bacterium]MCI0645245.1 DegT/DnrJ/EryC1/StrS aminotransferase family protein [Chloroflexota bacterium]MCI0725317.1 DegT/DnrJ/EryC1/StrS aminotransferase family protein [Chloroflexota bacterium]